MSKKELIQKLNEQATLVAVSKTKPVEAIIDLYENGQRIFGENRVQELVEKEANLPKDIEWHMIGHLQKNKVKYIAPFVSLIHGVDNLKLLKTINKEGKKNNRMIPCLLQIHIAKESSKFGFTPVELLSIDLEEVLQDYDSVEIRGLMGMATFTSDEDQVRSEFRLLKQLFDEIALRKLPALTNFNEISMGMSGDYKIAIEEGSTMIRIGSLLFGAR